MLRCHYNQPIEQINNSNLCIGYDQIDNVIQ